MTPIKLSSPALPFLKWVLVAAAFGSTLWWSVREIHMEYMRWADIATSARFATGPVSMVVSVIVAYNVSALFAPRLFTNTPLGKYPAGVQVVLIAVSSAILAMAGMILGYVPVIGVAVAQMHTMSASVLLTFSACMFFLCATGLVSSLIGLALRKYNPVIAAAVALLISYFVVAFSANSIAPWAVAPVNANEGYSYILAAARYPLIATLTTGLLAVGLGLLVRWLTTAVETQRRGAYLPAVAIGLIAAFGVPAAIQFAAGTPKELGHDVCATTEAGSEVCVHRADEPGLDQATADLAALEATFDSFLLRPTEPTRLAEARSLLRDSPGVEIFEIGGQQRRMDVSTYVLDRLGFSNCQYGSPEGAMVIDQVAVFMVKQSGTYTRLMDENGGFASVSNEDGSDYAAEDMLASLPPDEAKRRIQANVDAITACQGAYSMLLEPGPVR